MSDSKSGSSTRTIRVGALARVEGEGALHLVMRQGHIEQSRLDIYEPPRFFEALLRGRSYAEVPDITARICGICPVAYQMGACHALEKAFGVFDAVDPAIRSLRTLLYCGEWIESHVLHMFMLHLPDFLGYESAITMANDHRDLVQRALRIKKVGNAIVSLLAGRSVHPVGVKVGGFYSAPAKAQAAALLPEIRACLQDMCELTTFLAKEVRYPDFRREYEFVALCPENEYPMNLGRIVSSAGLNIDQHEFGAAIEERQVEHSTALHSVIRGRGAYLVGPLARLNLNQEKLHPRALELLPAVCAAVGAQLPWHNTFLGLPARALETVHALATAEAILAGYSPPARASIPITPKAGIGGHGTEAPRGICWHQYATEADGTIVAARIVPPTSQNQGTIERDLCAYAQTLVTLDDEPLALRCEQLIRNYDPCISCSVHFLRIDRIPAAGQGDA